MNAMIETLKNWDTRPADVRHVIEKHEVEIADDDGTNVGKVEVTCKFVVVGDRKIPLADRPIINSCMPWPREWEALEDEQLYSIREEDGFVLLVLAPGTFNTERALRTTIAAE